MSSRVIAGAVIVLVLVVGGIMLLVGSLAGGDSDKGDNGTAPAPAHVVAQRGIPADA
jgi:hypothetical protein